MAIDPKRVKELFGAAMEQADAPARQAFLDRECAGDEELRARLDVLLAANESPHEALNQPLVREPAGPTATFEGAEAIGTVIAGKYKLLQEIGEGGMGSVFMADQTQPVKRRVAVKVIKAGMDSARVLARFEAERQALALMDHPHIAKVLDAGATEIGRPFFVMELVKGVPLMQYCDERKLPVLDRLNLFRQVCSAVQHAHQKGIIHRDLKPSNILVESHDGQPVPKVIDFGLAKATSGLQLTEQTLFTALGTVAGTPLYMAPEQAAFNAVDIDTRADVYALGVILYELLTGTTPIERATFKKAAFDEMLRLIREQEPATPSSRISSSESRASVAAQRRMEPDKLGRYVRGELDWIVMKSLSKERDRRYESATAFAKDVERFLNHEPVLAGPPSAAYKLRKFVRRNRLQVIAGAVVVLALLAGMAGTTFGLVRAQSARNAEAKQRAIAVGKQREAEASAKSEARQRAMAEASAKSEARQREIAERRERDAKAAERLAIQREQEEKRAREQAEEVSGFMQRVFAQGSAEGQASKSREVNRTLTVKEAMDFASEAIEGQFADRPEIEAALRATIGKTYQELGAYPEAETHLKAALSQREKVLGADHPDTLRSANNLAMLYMVKADYPAAEPLLKRATAESEIVLGADHQDTLMFFNNLATLYRETGNYTAAEPLFRRALAGLETILGADDPGTLATVHNLAWLYWLKTDYAAAEPLYLRALAGSEKTLSVDHPETLSIVNNLAMLYQAKADYPAAETLFLRALAAYEKNLGANHPDTLGTVTNLASLYQAKADYTAAEPLFLRALAGMEKSLGADHPYTLNCVTNLATLHFAKGDYAAAEPLLKRALTGYEKTQGAEHPDTLRGVNNLAILYLETADFAAAEPALKRALAGYEKVLGADHLTTLSCVNNLAALYLRRGEYAAAEPQLKRAVAAFDKALGAEHPNTRLALANLGLCYKIAGRFDEALTLLERAYQSVRNDPQFAWVGAELLDAYVKAGKRAEATQLVNEQLAANRQRLTPDSPELGGLLAVIGNTMLAFDPAAAEPVLRECLALREKLDPQAWNTANAKSLLGGALLLQEKYADAEPLLLQGYQGLKEREAAIPPQGKICVKESLDRLIELYIAWEKPAEATKWQALAEPEPPAPD